MLTPRSWFARKLSDEHPLDRNELQSKHTVRGAEERVVWGGEGRGGGGKVWRPPVSGVSVGLCVWRLAGNAHCGLPTMRRQGGRDSWLGSAECTSRSTRAAVTEATGAVCGAARCGVPGYKEESPPTAIKRTASTDLPSELSAQAQQHLRLPAPLPSRSATQPRGVTRSSRCASSRI